jgi:hypothetical protein
MQTSLAIFWPRSRSGFPAGACANAATAANEPATAASSKVHLIG